MDFCMQISKHMMLEEIKGSYPRNAVLSPLSLNMVLNMITAGMTGGSLELLLKLLGSEKVEDIKQKSREIMAVTNNTGEEGPCVTSINGVWVDQRYPMKASYAKLLKEIYNCEANSTCDFANKGRELLNEINSWAESASRGLIKNVLQFIDPDTSFVRANALYFKGSWYEPFDPDVTRPNKFYLLNGTVVQVPFLANLWSFDFGSFDGYKVLRAPYGSYETGQSTFSMYFYLPEEKNGLPNLLEQFKSDSESMFLKPSLKHMELDRINIPKFKFSFDFDADKAMEKMGLYIPHKGNTLDYAEMIQIPENLPPINTTIIQKAFIEIDEYGTEASAVTVEVPMGCCWLSSPPPPKPTFVADHPFMFVIKEDKLGLVLFTGIVLDPSDSSESD